MVLRCGAKLVEIPLNPGDQRVDHKSLRDALDGFALLIEGLQRLAFHLGGEVLSGVQGEGKLGSVVKDISIEQGHVVFPPGLAAVSLI